MDKLNLIFFSAPAGRADQTVKRDKERWM
jgi:hypothetical protein